MVPVWDGTLSLACNNGSSEKLLDFLIYSKERVIGFEGIDDLSKF